MRTWASRYETFLGNVTPYPGMLEVLGESTGLTPKSLSGIGLGWAPVVEFKKKTSFSGWWVIPERDAEGAIVGLSLRSPDGKAKVMYPGSKHGLVYQVAAGYKAGTKEYVPGSHNWVRTMDAGVPCPVCHKPDGCLLSAENPADPKAVMCIREKIGAISATKTGDSWLHIRKAEGNIAKSGPLAGDPNDFVLVVEGMSDTAAGMDLGFPAVGRPSNMAGMGYLKQLLRGRKCIIIGENDLKADGRWPGKEGMEAAFETLRASSDPRKIMPPEDVKDFREWVRKHGLTRDAFLAYVGHHGSSESDDRTLDSNEPLKVAERWLKENHYVDGLPILRRYASAWFRFDGKCYVPKNEEADVRGRIYAWLTDRNYKALDLNTGEAQILPFNADRSKVGNIIDALSRDCPLQAEPPCWLDGRTDMDPRNLICFPNGVLDVPTYLNDGTTTLHPLSPLFFTFNVMPYDFDPTAQCPLFMAALGQIFPTEPKKRLLLQEWFGYNCVPDISQQKFMLFIGPAGTGKSTIISAMTAMLGAGQVAITSLHSLGEQFGLGHLIGKLSAIVPDGHIGRQTDSKILMERLKVMTGENDGRMQVRRMREDASDARFFARLTMAANELPELPDDGNALQRRTLALQFTESFVGKEDRSLPDKLAKEASGILNWALQGLDRLYRQGHFTIPDSSEELGRQFAMVASPLQQFVYECCEVGSAGFTMTETMYDCWRNWCKDRGVTAGMRMKFNHNLTLNIPSIRQINDVKNGQKESRFNGISLTKAARDKYLGA